MITYGGIPLLLDDPGGEIQAWMDRYLPLGDARTDCPPRSIHSQQATPRGDQVTSIGLSRPNYPAGPRPEVNVLYWPTGAARWAQGWFFATGAAKDKILASVGTSGAALPLVLDDENGNSITTNMFLLAPRAVSSIAESKLTDGTHQLWLLPLVDDRWNWQDRNFGNTATTSSTSWSTLYSTIGSGLGVTITADAVNADYLNPDPSELTRPYQNAAMLLDAVAHSVGQRVIRNLDGTVKAVDFNTSTTTLTANRNLPWLETAGEDGELHAAAEKVTVVFRKYTQHRPYGDGSVYSYDKTVTLGTKPLGPVSAIPGTRRTVFSTAYANFDSGSSSPDNDTKLSTLAQRIQTDYTLSLSQKVYDRTFVSLLKWAPSGFDDHVRWSFGARAHDGTYLAQTRVQSMPPNFGIEEMLHQDPDLKVIGPVQLAKLTGSTTPLTGGTRDTFTVWQGTPGSESVTSPAITIKAGARFDPVDKTGFAWLNWDFDNNGWYAIESEHLALQIGGTLSGTLTAGGSVTCAVSWSLNGTSPGTSITIYSAQSFFTGTSGKQFEAKLNRTDGKYYFTWVQC